MTSKYEKAIDQWNDIFSGEIPETPAKLKTGNEQFDKGLEWLCQDSVSVLDFGCGTGSLLFVCSNYGTKEHLGIDLSENAIQYARKRAAFISEGKFNFVHGSIERLNEVENSTFDAVILSNIIDNLYPADAEDLLTYVERLLKENGKVFVKLNPYITTEQIKEWKIRIIEDNLLDDGFVLWNNTTEQWLEFFEKSLEISHYEDIYFPEHEQYNRMILLTKRKG